MKKALSFFLTAALIFSLAVNSSAQFVTDSYTPVSPSNAELKWSVKFGASYRSAPCVPIVAQDHIAVLSGKKLYKINKNDGSVIDCAEMSESVGFGYVPPLYNNGIIYCPLDYSVIEAYDFDSMQLLWRYEDVTEGQSFTPIVYDDGCIYTGFWYDEDEPGRYVCLDAKTGELIWAFEHMGGFYWAGCAIKDDHIVFGGDDGTIYDDRSSTLFCLDKKTGELIDTAEIKGDQRSSVVYDEITDRFFFVTKAGYVYSVKIENGRFASLKSLYLGGSSTSSPNVYGGRVYVGVQKDGFGGGCIAVIDSEKLEMIYEAETVGYPQSEVLITTSYDDICIYFTCNTMPGGIYMLKDSPDSTQGTVKELFAPPAGQIGYSVSPICADESGTLYFKNDSCYVFAVENAAGGRFVCFIKEFAERIKSIVEILTLIYSVLI